METGVQAAPGLYEPISEWMGLCEALIQRALQTGRPTVDRVLADLPFGGKRLRPTLLLLFAAMGSARRERVVKLAAGMELLHWATLVHDDVIDESDIRRGQPALHCRRGERAAVIVGDFLFARAYDFFASCGASACRTADALVKAMCEGELMQMASGYRPERTEEDYFDCIEKKTAIFIATACQMGAESGNLALHLCKAAARFGNALGMSYQIMDDLQDFNECVNSINGVNGANGVNDAHGLNGANAAATGAKLANRGNDAARGLFTLPLIHYYRSRKVQEQARRQRHDGKLTLEWSQTCWNVLGSDPIIYRESLSYACEAAACFLEKACEALDLFPAGAPKVALGDLVNALDKSIQNMRKG